MPNTDIDDAAPLLASFTDSNSDCYMLYVPTILFYMLCLLYVFNCYDTHIMHIPPDLMLDQFQAVLKEVLIQQATLQQQVKRYHDLNLERFRRETEKLRS